MKELFGKQHFIVLYSFLMELMNLNACYKNTLEQFNMDEKEIAKRMLFLKLMETPYAKWTTNDYPVMVDTINFMFNLAYIHRDKIDNCFVGIDKLMKKEGNYMWNRRNTFMVKKILNNITERNGDYVMDFTANWDGDFIAISC